MTASRQHDTAGRGFEPSDVPARGVAYSVLGLFAGIALSAAFVAGLLFLLAHRSERLHPAPPAAQRELPPPPRLEVAPSADRARIESDAQRLLHSYAWVDRAAGRVRIPIDRAMQIMVERGWPDDRETGAPPR